MTEKIPAIYAALDEIRQEIDKQGIAKKREVIDGVRFKFRGIDDVMDTFSGIMAKAKVMPLPHYSNPTVEVRATNAGKPNYNRTVEMQADLVSLVDGSLVTIGPFFGEASDTADKSFAKAQSIAFRLGILLSFVVPLGPSFDPEADAEQQAETGQAPVVKPKAKKVAPKPAAPAKQGWDPSVTPAVKSWLMKKAGMAGYEGEHEVFARWGWITKENAQRIGDELMMPENQK